MKQQLFYTLIGIALSLSVCAQTNFSFSDFGYPDETIIYGSQGKTSFFIPAGEAVFLKESQVTLNFKLPEVINHKSSFITVAVGGQPVSTKRPNINTHQIKFQIDLNTKVVSSGFIRIDVYTNLKVGEEICEIYNEGVFWAKLLESSKISLKTNSLASQIKIPKTINTALTLIEHLAIPSQPTINELKYASYILFYFKREFSKELNLISLDDTVSSEALDQAIILGKVEHLPSGITDLVAGHDITNNGLVLLQSTLTENSTTQSIYQRNIIVTGTTEESFSKAAKTLLHKNILNSAFSSYISVEKGAELKTFSGYREFEKVLFEDLDVNNEIIEGIGKISRDINIPRSVFGSNIKQLELQFNTTYRPVRKDENAYVNFYFDDVLIKSFALDQTGEFTKVLNFDNFKIKKNNILKVEYYFVPKGGMCVANATSFYAQINSRKSWLRPLDYEEEPRLNYFYFPENFQSNPTQIFIDQDLGFKKAEALAELLDIMNPGNSTQFGYVYPEVKPTSFLSQSFENDSLSKIIVTEDQAVQKQVLKHSKFLKVDDSTHFYEHEMFDTFFDITYEDQLGLNHLFYKDNTPTMLIYNPKGEYLTLDNLVNRIKGQYLSNTGNTILATPTQSYFFDLAKKISSDNSQVKTSAFELYWDKYSIFVVFVLLVLFILILVLVFKKSQESKKNILDEN
jgi:hypothetical protein